MDAVAIARFLKFVTLSTTLFYEGAPCWDYHTTPRADGYRQCCWHGKRGSYVHRVAYELFHGPIPEGHDVDHRCKNRGCCNPAHLEALPISENRAQGFGLRTSCSKGHPYSEENTYLTKTGTRACRDCNRERVATYNAEHPEKRQETWKKYEQRKAQERRAISEERWGKP